MKLAGEVDVDGKKQRFEASSVTLQFGVTQNEDAKGSAQMGAQVTETISISGGKLTTTVTTTSADGKSTTTTTTTTPVEDPK